MYIVFIICPSPSILKHTNKTGRAYFIILLSQFLFFVFFFSFFFHLEKNERKQIGRLVRVLLFPSCSFVIVAPFSVIAYLYM
jgi:hypothetical protein